MFVSRLKFRVKYFNNKKVIQDFLLLIASIVVTAVFSIEYEWTESFFEFTRHHEELELDEAIVVLAISSFYLCIFTLRRFFELKNLVLRANTDPLIGITNRRKGSEYIENEISQVNTHAKYHSSLIMYDIDHFKKVNDLYGHDVGDVILKEISEIVLKEIEVRDLLIRWGGEEFILICQGSGINEAINIAEKFRAKIDDNIFSEGIKLSSSFGVYELNGTDSLRKQLIKVDQNLYRSKENGRNKVTG